MSGEFPFLIAPSSITISSEFDVVQSFSQSKRRYSRITGGHLWRLSIDLPEMTREEYRNVYAFLQAQFGTHDTFLITMQGFLAPLGNVGGTPLVKEVTNDNVIVCSGFTNDVQDAVRAGDLFTIAGDEKVYMCVLDTDSDAIGDVVILFQPGLTQLPSTGDAITFNNVKMNVALDGSFPSLKRNGYTASYSFNCVEVIA